MGKLKITATEEEFPEIAELPAEAFYVAPRESDQTILDAQNKLYTHTEPVYTEGNFLVIRNSKFGACPREIWAYGSGVEPGREKQEGGVFREGHLHEADVKSQMREWGWVLENEEEEFNFRIGSVIIRGHADVGLLRLPGDNRSYCCEIKSFGHDAWEKWQTFGFDAYPGYRFQISVMSHALGRPAVFLGKNRDNGRLTDPIIWDEPPISRLEIIKRALMIKNAIDGNNMPDCGSARKFFQGWCLFSQLHKDEPIPEGSVLRPELEWVLTEYRDLKKGKENEERREELTRMISREMPGEVGVPLIAGQMKAVFTEAMKLDRKKLANDFPEAFKACLIPGARALRVSALKDRGLLDEGEDD